MRVPSWDERLIDPHERRCETKLGRRTLNRLSETTMATLEETQPRSKYDHLMAQCQRLAPVRIALAHAGPQGAVPVSSPGP